MKNSGRCPKCGSMDIVRVPDYLRRYTSGNNIYTTSMTLIGKIPVIRYVCCRCGCVENWVEKAGKLDTIGILEIRTVKKQNLRLKNGFYNLNRSFKQGKTVKYWNFEL